MHRTRTRALLGAALAAILVLAAGCGHHQQRHKTPTPTPTGDTHGPVFVPAPGPSGPTGPSGPAGAPAVTPSGDLQTNQPAELRDAGTQGVPKTVIHNGARAAGQTADQLDLPAPTRPINTGGAQLNPCVSGHEATNRASYGSVHPNSVFGTILHYTVSANVPGTGDIIGVRNYLNQVGLSASDIMDFEGNCIHDAPYQYDAYTQGNMNRYYDSIEIIATGKETRAQWLAAPIFSQHILANYLRSRLQARGVPLRFVDPNECTPQAGYSDHNHLECGNDHIDVSPNFPFDVLAAQLRQGIVIAITARDRSTCAKIHAYRHRPARQRRPGAHGRQHARLKFEHQRRHECAAGKPRQT